MPIVKIIPSKSNPGRLEAYLKNPEKTDESLWFGNLCDFDHVAESFIRWNENMGKADRPENRSYYHIIIAWNTAKDTITPEQCQKMAREICCRAGLSEYPYYGTVHFDKQHLHAHIMVDNCSIYGKSYQSTRSSTEQLKELGNEICRREGYIHSIVDTKKKAAERVTDAEARIILEKGQIPWKDKLRYQLDEAMKHAASLAEFKERLKREYQIEVSTNRKGELRFLPPDFEKRKGSDRPKPCSARRLGDKYSRTVLEETFRKNQKLRKEWGRKGGIHR